MASTSVWSLAFRRNQPQNEPAVNRLRQAPDSGEAVFSTGLVLQELLQGFAGSKTREAIIQRFGALPLLVPDRQDHFVAAEIRNACRRAGVHIGTIDALLARLCTRDELILPTTDRDLDRMRPQLGLIVWGSSTLGPAFGPFRGAPRRLRSNDGET